MFIGVSKNIDKYSLIQSKSGLVILNVTSTRPLRINAESNFSGWFVVIIVISPSLENTPSKQFNKVEKFNFDVVLLAFISRLSVNIASTSSNNNNELEFLDDDFIRISHEQEPTFFIELMETIMSKNVVIVGPEYLSKLNKHFKFRHIKVPLKNCYNDIDRITEEIKIIDDTESGIIFLFSASMPSNIIIDKFDSNRNTYIDWGSVWDTFFDSARFSFIKKRSTSNHNKFKLIYKKYMI